MAGQYNLGAFSNNSHLQTVWKKYLLGNIYENSPWWKNMVSKVCLPLFVHTPLKQTAYWLVSRRVKKVYHIISVRGILKSTFICGLGASFAGCNLTALIWLTSTDLKFLLSTPVWYVHMTFLQGAGIPIKYGP